MRLLVLVAACLAGLLGTLAATPATAQGPAAAPTRRVALVMGNQDYRHINKLENAVADARAMAAMLRSRNFEVVDGYDLDRSQMNRLFNRFESSMSAGAVAVLYFAGHGVQVGGINVLVPVDMQPENERDLLDDGIPMPALMERMAGVNGRRDGGLNLLIIDACRDNPFRAAGRSLGVTRGLAAGGAAGAMVIYAAASNQRALDKLGPADRDPNGVLTRTLLRAMAVPGLPVREMVARVRQEVAQAARGSGYEQTPAVYDEAEGDYIFSPGAANAQTLAVTAPAGQTTPAAPAPDREGVFWDSMRNSSNAADFEAYLQTYPAGAFAALARSRLAALRAPAAAAPPPARTAATAPATPASQRSRPRGQGPARTVRIVNASGGGIDKLLFDPTSQDGSSPDRLTAHPMLEGQVLELRLPPGECSYDMYLEFAGNRRGAQFSYGIDTCRESTLTLR
jgi:uncharacterized caspase-like protein